MNKYVLVFAVPVLGDKGSVLVILKDRPEWQNGKINLCGGKIEEGETPEKAAIRELKEETGLNIIGNYVKVAGAIMGSWGIVFCVKVCVDQNIKLNPKEGETEIPFWAKWHQIKNESILMPNLKVVIPLMMTGSENWLIKDSGPDFNQKQHTFSVTLDI